MSDNVKLGRLIEGTAERDAVHVAVAPVIANDAMNAGDWIKFVDGSQVEVEKCEPSKAIGIVDPFLVEFIKKDQQFYMFLKPSTVTGMRHHWQHPSFTEEGLPPLKCIGKEYSIKWMTDWAIHNTPGNYCDYDECDESPIDPAKALEFAISAGRNNHIGPYESARKNIDNRWWDHWEVITGEKAGGRRDEYFSCSC